MHSIAIFVSLFLLIMLHKNNLIILMMMKIFLLTLVRDAIPDSNSAVVVNTLQKAVEPVEPKGLYDFAAIFF